MKILIVYAHPEPTSFNHALKDQALDALNLHETKISDLYAMNFNPVANWSDFNEIDDQLPRQYGVIQRDAYLKHQLATDIKAEQEKLAWCEVILFQFPLWWFNVPAILKGWFDRVLAAGFAYDKENWFATGLLQPRRALFSITTQSPASAYQEGAMHGDINQYLNNIYHTLRFVGITPLKPYVTYGVMNMEADERQAHLLGYQKYLHEILNNRDDNEP